MSTKGRICYCDGHAAMIGIWILLGAFRGVLHIAYVFPLFLLFITLSTYFSFSYALNI